MPGTALPSTRTLALDLGLHRKTIVAAYETLVSGNWVDNLPRKGFIVSPNLPVLRPQSYHNGRIGAYDADPGFEYEQSDSFPYPLSLPAKDGIIIDDGFPDITLLPSQVMLKEYRHALDHSVLKKISAGWDIEGSSDCRHALCDFLNQTRGIDIKTDNLLITRGAQMAIYIAAALIIKPGDKVIVCEPSYIFANMVFEQLGAELIRVPVDGEGMNTESVEEILKTQRVRLIYIIPHHHHPTTVTMSVARRHHLLRLIRHYQLAVIEDDYDYDFQFQYEPYLPLASGDHEGNIIYIGSLTKVLGAPFRLGYMVAPEKFIHAAATRRMLINLRGDIFTEQVVSNLIRGGELTRLIQKANKVYRQRCHFLADLLDTELGDVLKLTRPNGGMALWLRFNPDLQLTKILEKAAGRGLRIMGSIYAKGNNATYNALRFGFASLNEAGLSKAVNILKTSIHKPK
ncbi:aminotransferase-like domain-containing protein [Chitinophaga pinensis]|uniref:Transcriptional regulator, GntR family n=1 Tax=Chitinophaga pinensis (strain ATCC 43595 / DSM 2588 / LMG 13176 / NBRC 15968 / NCIMB 11800 / UQM 2034) TaxID=485918 RepID=A0A979G3R1_CHIPD|nr:PLP-dependent aminotransferase family protein [Chitinophaga pinensis]ACU60234.1 putative transcriptional regulator, GntR family [Chitinophaga pinensis DSM 2588]